MANGGNFLHQLNCVCTDDFTSNGLTPNMFVSMTGVLFALLIYMMGIWLSKLNLDKVDRIKWVFKIFNFIQSGTLTVCVYVCVCK
jgi:hypothetical protein